MKGSRGEWLTDGSTTCILPAKLVSNAPTLRGKGTWLRTPWLRMAWVWLLLHLSGGIPPFRFCSPFLTEINLVYHFLGLLWLNFVFFLGLYFARRLVFSFELCHVSGSGSTWFLYSILLFDQKKAFSPNKFTPVFLFLVLAIVLSSLQIYNVLLLCELICFSPHKMCSYKSWSL